MLSIRPYSSQDLRRLIDLFRGTVRSINSRDYTNEQTLAWAPDNIDLHQWGERLARNRCWVATMDEVPVGFIELGTGGVVDMLYVHHSYQQQGIGTRLLQELQDAAVAEGITELHTHCSITARPFLERHGFVTDAPQQVAVRGQSLTNFRMRKVLKNSIAQ